MGNGSQVLYKCVQLPQSKLKINTNNSITFYKSTHSICIQFCVNNNYFDWATQLYDLIPKPLVLFCSFFPPLFSREIFHSELSKQQLTVWMLFKSIKCVLLQYTVPSVLQAQWRWMTPHQGPCLYRLHLQPFLPPLHSCPFKNKPKKSCWCTVLNYGELYLHRK